MAKTIELKYKLLENYPNIKKCPPLQKAYKGDAGFDLYAAETKNIYGNTSVKIKTGLQIAIPEGYFGKIFDRSSIATGTSLHVKAGVVDSGYRGEIIVVMHNLKVDPCIIEKGQKIAQLVILPVPNVSVIQVEDFDVRIENDSGELPARETKGFGSSN